MPELQYINLGSPRNVELDTYPDSMPLVKSVTGRFVDRLLLRPRSLASFVAAMFWVDAFRERKGYTPSLILPFVPGARQDRLNDTGDQLFTIKSIAGMINARNFPSVTILDPHSDVTPSLIDRCRVVHAADVIDPPPGKYAAVISPDAGAEKRAGAVARKLGVSLIHAWKTRDVSTGAIDGFGFDSNEVCSLVRMGEKIRMLIVDDICDGGGTFIGLAEAFNAHHGRSVDLHLFTTHGIYSKNRSALLDSFSHVYCTDSLVSERPARVIEINVCQKLLEGTL